VDFRYRLAAIQFSPQAVRIQPTIADGHEWPVSSILNQPKRFTRYLTTMDTGLVPNADVQWSATERQQWEVKPLFIFIQWRSFARVA
jgi:hypothetical protein